MSKLSQHNYMVGGLTMYEGSNANTDIMHGHYWYCYLMCCNLYVTCMYDHTHTLCMHVCVYVALIILAILNQAHTAFAPGFLKYIWFMR